MSVLQEIVARTKSELPSRDSLSLQQLEKSSFDVKAALSRKEKSPALIAEIKRKSPSRGEIRKEITVAEAIEFYKNHASAISVLTEPHYFGGSLEDLKRAASLTDIPLLRKDFIIDPIQIWQAREAGAAFYLLIVAALSPSQLSELIAVGRELNMPALIEVHTIAEMQTALEAGAEILGINNRDLNTLKIDLKTTHEIVSEIPPEKRKELILVSESGISSRTDIETLPEEISAVLIGTSLMSSENPREKLSELFPL